LRHGPHAASDVGPKIATTGFFKALAMCSGTESTQSNTSLNSIKAPNSFNEISPANTCAPKPRPIACAISFSAGSGPEVITIFFPLRSNLSINSLIFKTGQHLKRHRDVG
jgi:hypothetical protein